VLSILRKEVKIMAKTLTINGVNFEVKTPRKNKLSLESVINTLDRNAGRTIYDCYDRPSEVKLSIYNEWLDWYTGCDDDTVDYFGVSSYNGFNFSLQALAEVDGYYYLISITKANNTATLIE
jgi:hypothetical protein